jgi:Tol biopolymer transport system component
MRVLTAKPAVLVGLFVLLLILTAWGSNNPVDAQTSTTPKIAFTSDRDGNREIYVMNADGSNQTRLTNNQAFDYAPTWSPDGKRIAFVSGDSKYDIYVMDADGSNQTRLTNNQAFDGNPTWFPDGKRIAFISDRDSNSLDLGGESPQTDYLKIYAMDADGSNQTRLTNTNARDLAWSPDGRQIAFTSGREDEREIYVMNADGSNLTNLTNNPADDYAPTWSPDGRRIALCSYRDGEGVIYTVNADGSNKTRVINTPTNAFYIDKVAWSPDGRQIAFTDYHVYNGGDTSQIYVMNADGSNLTKLTNSYDASPAWSPDGRRIAFWSKRPFNYNEIGANTEIYVMDADGSNLTRLTNNPADDNHPAWQPMSPKTTQ